MKNKPYSKKRICLNCNQAYNARSPQSRVCSDVCKKEVRKRAYTKFNNKRIEENRVTHKLCVNCGEEFELKSNAQRYCSEKCKKDAVAEVSSLPKERECKYCKKPFSPSVHNNLYCDKICYQKSVDDRRIKKLKERGSIKKKCKQCNNSFFITAANNVYCSLKCKDEVKKEKIREFEEYNSDGIGNYNTRYYHENKVLKGGFSEKRNCLVCGSAFTANNSGSKYCSKECKWKIHYKTRKDRGQIKYDGEYFRKYHKHRRDNDPMFNLIGRIRHRTREAIKRGGFTKKSKTYEMLGCDWETLKRHIENQFAEGMSWENMSEWDLDHIYPLAWCSTINELEIYSHYTNLQPLWRADNQKKGDKYIG